MTEHRAGAGGDGGAARASRNGKAAGVGAAAQVDADAARRSLARMQSIFRDIATAAEESQRTRCPYKDAKSRCTAKFGCGYQHFVADPTALPVCTCADSLDYRSAWESSAEPPASLR